MVSTRKTVVASVPSIELSSSQATLAAPCGEGMEPTLLRMLNTAPPSAALANLGSMPVPVMGFVTK